MLLPSLSLHFLSSKSVDSRGTSTTRRPPFPREGPSACRMLQRRIDIGILTHLQTVQLILFLIKMHLINHCHCSATSVPLLHSQQDIQLEEIGSHPCSAHHIVIQVSKLATISTSRSMMKFPAIIP